MALRGNLKDFSLPDVFQLVTFSKKTGVLRIRRLDGSDGSVWFRDGEVFFAQSNWRGEPLGERLVHAGKVTPSALSRALEIRSVEGDSGRRLGEILVDEGYITAKVLEAFVQEQIQDTIFDLMRWDEGGFDFELLPEVVSEDIGLSISIENVIMEGSRRLEEWARIKKKIPSMEIVFKMATAPGEGTFEISLKPIEWNLLLLVDGTRSVAELALETARTDFEVSRIMYGLFSAGLLEVAPDDEVARLRSERAEREAVLAAIRARESAERAESAPEVEEPGSELSADVSADSGVNAVSDSEPEIDLEPDYSLAPPSLREPRAEPEMPSFLADETVPATAEDMDVFERMMGAVLEHPVAAEPEAPVVEPEAPVVEPEPAAEEPETLEHEPLFIESDQEPMTAEPDSVSVLERDLLALGLGELPSEGLLLPAESTDEIAHHVPLFADPAPEPEFGVTAETEPEQLPELEVEFTSDDVAESGPEFAPGHAVDLDAPLAGVSETDDDMPFEEFGVGTILGDQSGAGVIRFESPDIEFTRPDDDEPDASSGQIEPGQVVPDFSALLESLDSGSLEIVQTHDLEDDLDDAPTTPGGVISTDAFLADIKGEVLGGGLTGGLGAELSALTGAKGARRPTASVNRIPEPGQGIELRLDRTVDKDLVLKIIEGIRNL